MIPISAIITTYNHPKWLEKTLWSYQAQNHPDFEVVVADDGSGEETKAVIERMRSEVGFPIKHVWHADEGYRKCDILNKATVAAQHEYLFYSDGDCLARQDLLSTHASLAETGYFLSGAYFKLTLPVSQKLSQKDILSQKAFDVDYLQELGQPSSSKMMKLKHRGAFAKILDGITPTKATWNGHGSSGWKKDILAVNGYNEEMKYGGQDRELGERMMNNGIRTKQIRHRSCLLHLDHSRGYATEDVIEKNKEIRRQVKEEKRAWTERGIDQYLD